MSSILYAISIFFLAVLYWTPAKRWYCYVWACKNKW